MRCHATTPFRIAATELTLKGVDLTDIAGNSSVILVTAISDGATQAVPAGARLLFEQPILTQPGRKRSAIVLPVCALSRFLASARGLGIDIEHVYDS